MILNWSGELPIANERLSRSYWSFLSSDQFRYLTTVGTSDDLGWIALEERHDKHHHKIVRDRDRYYIAGGGIANRLFFAA